MRSAKAFAPANLSLMFEVIEHNNPLKKGSNGVGFTVNCGVTVRVKHAEVGDIFVNGVRRDFPTISTVLKKMKCPGVEVSIYSPLPFGCGFGLSGASAIATAYALNKLLGLQKTTRELYDDAHYAEVVNGTGLGDVEGQVNGGFLIKKNHLITKLPFTGKKLYAVVFAPLKTSEVITSKVMKKKINVAGKKAIACVTPRRTFSEIFTISRSFAEGAGLVLDRRVAAAISSVEDKGGFATMIMLGHAVIATQKEGLMGFGKLIPLTITEKKVMLVE